MAEKNSTQTEEHPDMPPLDAAVTGSTHGKKEAEAEGDGEQPDSGENESSASAAGDSENPEEQKKRRSRDRRVRSMNRKLRAAEAEKAELAAQLKEAREALQASRNQAAPKPKRGDYESDDDFAEAYMAYKNAASASPKPAAKPAKKAQALSKERIDGWIGQGVEKHGDSFREAARAPIKLTAETADWLMRDPQGHELYLGLVADPDLADEVASVSSNPRDLMEALEDLRESLSEGDAQAPERGEDGRFKKKVPAKKTVSKAPRTTPPAGRTAGGQRQDFSHLNDQQVLSHNDLDARMREWKEQDARQRGLIPPARRR